MLARDDGQLRTASRDQHPELFWALRGGGGNFGVVTRFSFRLHQVGPTITGGPIWWSAERADEVLHGPRTTLGPPWAKDHRMALAATVVAGSAVA